MAGLTYGNGDTVLPLPVAAILIGASNRGKVDRVLVRSVLDGHPLDRPIRSTLWRDLETIETPGGKRRQEQTKSDGQQPGQDKQHPV